jgi:hypothetical protein
MTVQAPGHQLAHPAVQAFMARNGISQQDLRSDGRLSLTLDQKYRVQVHSTSHNRVALSSELLSLAGRYDDRVTGDALERLMALGAGMLQQHASTLCVDDRRQALTLQQTLPASADGAGVELAIAEFVNVLPFWLNACASETRLMASR